MSSFFSLLIHRVCKTLLLFLYLMKQQNDTMISALQASRATSDWRWYRRQHYQILNAWTPWELSMMEAQWLVGDCWFNGLYISIFHSPITCDLSVLSEVGAADQIFFSLHFNPKLQKTVWAVIPDKVWAVLLQTTQEWKCHNYINDDI